MSSDEFIQSTIEMPDKQILSVKYKKNSTPKEVLKIIGEQNKIKQTEYFGLQRLVEVYSVNETQEELWCFMNEDFTISDQDPKLLRLRCLIRYFPLDPRSELICPKTSPYFCDEVISRLKGANSFPNGEVVIQIAALYQQYTVGDYNPNKKITSTSELSSIFSDAVISKFIKGEAQFKGICTAHALLFGIKEHELIVKFISYVSETIPWLLSTNYDVKVASSSESNLLVTMSISPIGIRFSHQENVILYIPTDQVFDWNLTEVVGGAAQHTTLTKTRRFSQLIQETTLEAPESMPKKKKRNKASALSMALLAPVSPKSEAPKTDFNPTANRKKYVLSIVVETEYLQDVELYCFSRYSNDFRISDLLQFYSDKAVERVYQRSSDKIQCLIDDPVAYKDSPIFCKAKYNFYSENEGELIFLKDEDIKVEKKMEKGFYYGSCNDRKGVFRGSMVTFRKSSFIDLSKPTLIGSMKQDSMLQAQWILSDPNQGFIVGVRLMDDTKMMLAVTVSTTPLALIQQISDKIELKDTTMFQICDSSEGYDRWLHPKIAVISQGITSTSKLLFKVRAYTKPIQEVSDPVAIHLIFEQSRLRVLKEEIKLSETEILELSGFHLQILLSDHDKNLHKPGYFENVEQFIPPSILPTHNNLGWQKRMFLTHQRYLGLSRTQAEKAYLKRLFGNSEFSRTFFACLSPAGDMIGVSPTGLTLMSGQSKEMTYEFGESLLDWTNSSLSLEIEVRQSGNTLSLQFIPENIASVIELLWVYNSERIRRPLQEKCHRIRRAFELLDVNLVNPYDSIGSKYDPELLASCLKNGVSLCHLINMIKPAEKPVIKLIDNESDDIPEYKCLDNISIFLDVCGRNSTYWDAKGLGMLEDDLFSPEQLYYYSLENFDKVIECLLKLFVILNVEAVMNLAGMNRLSVRTSVIGDPLRKQLTENFSSISKNILDELDIVVMKYLEPVREQSIIPVKQISIIFRNVEVLYMFQKQFHENIPEDNSQLFGYLSEKFDCNDIYSTYFKGQHDAFVELTKMRTDINFKQFLISLDSNDPNRPFNDLQNLLTKPTTFMLKMDDFVKTSLSSTAEKHPDFKKIYDLSKRLSAFFSKVKNVKKLTDDVKTISVLQQKIVGLQNINLFDFGELIISGNLHSFAKEMIKVQYSKETVFQPENSYQVFLFETHLVMCKRQARGHQIIYELYDCIPLHLTVTKSSISGEGMIEFKTHHYQSFEVSRMDRSRTLVFVAPSYEIKAKWVNSIDTISKNQASVIQNLITNEDEMAELVKKAREKKE